MSDPAATHGLWADLHQADARPENSDFTVIGIPYDGLASARKGARLGPERIRFWSQHMTPFSEDRTRLRGLSVCDIGDLPVSEPERDFERVCAQVAGLPNVPIVLGGDHSVTIPVLRGQRGRFRNRRLGLLWMDAHPDLCDEFAGSQLSHACVLRRALEYGLRPADVCMIGLRSWEDQEIDLIEHGGLNVYTAREVAERGAREIAQSVHGVLSQCEAVHISVDIDCLDPGYAPGTGIPDAAGLSPRDVLTILGALQGLPLVGLDVVEVAPSLDPSEATVFAALKIIMEFIALFAKARQER